jgi:uncharacterized protein (TIGR03905 family)
LQKKVRLKDDNMYEFQPRGVCPVAIRFDVRDDKVHDVQYEGGCNGNLKALGKLVEGMDVQECIGKLKGIQCGSKPTSCGDQLAAALELARQEIEKEKAVSG